MRFDFLLPPRRPASRSSPSKCCQAFSSSRFVCCHASDLLLRIGSRRHAVHFFFLFPLFAWLGNIVMYHLLFSCTLHMIMHYLFSFFFGIFFAFVVHMRLSPWSFYSSDIILKYLRLIFFFTLLSLKHCTRSLWGYSGASLRKPRPPISRSLRQAGKMPHSQAWFVVLHYV